MKKIFMMVVVAVALSLGSSANAYDKNTQDMIDTLTKYAYEYIATGNPKSQFPFSQEYVTQLAGGAREGFGEQGVKLTNEQTLLLLGAMFALKSEQFPPEKFKKNIELARNDWKEPDPNAGKQSPKWLPKFDINGYCASMAKQIDGGASLENSCRKREQRSLEEILDMDVDEKTGRHCVKMAKQINAGYSLVASCIRQEQKAMKEMGR